MYVCSCFGITEADVRRHAAEGRCSPRAIASNCRAGTDCGSCVRRIQALLGRTQPAPANASPAMAVTGGAGAPAAPAPSLAAPSAAPASPPAPLPACAAAPTSPCAHTPLCPTPHASPLPRRTAA